MEEEVFVHDKPTTSENSTFYEKSWKNEDFLGKKKTPEGSVY